MRAKLGKLSDNGSKMPKINATRACAKKIYRKLRRNLSRCKLSLSVAAYLISVLFEQSQLVTLLQLHFLHMPEVLQLDTSGVQLFHQIMDSWSSTLEVCVAG